jgi:hypothetical protein
MACKEPMVLTLATVWVRLLTPNLLNIVRLCTSTVLGKGEVWRRALDSSILQRRVGTTKEQQVKVAYVLLVELDNEELSAQCNVKRIDYPKNLLPPMDL